jgi:hypothetical protein
MASNRFTRACGLAILAAALGIPASAANLFRYVPIPKSQRAPEALVAPSAVEMDFAAVLAAGPGTTFEAQLPNGRTISVAVERVERHGNGDISWSGKVVDASRSDLAAVGTTGANGTYAEFETTDGTWGIVPSDGGHEWLFDKGASQARMPPPARPDDALVPPDRDPTPHPKATCPAGAGMPAPQATVDVLVVTTPDFVATHGGAAAAETRINNIFSSLNAYNTASNIAFQYRRVATMNVNYQAASTAGDDDAAALTAITGGTGPFANVASIRNFYGADMVALLRGPKNTAGNSISGIAWINGDRNGNISAADAGHMYSVSGDWRFPGAMLIAHELGHNLGNNHDRPNAGAAASGTTPYSYGHFVCGAGASATCGQAGFNSTGTGFGTLMSYHQPVVGKFSSPYLTCQGTQANALSAACGVADLQDDVRATNCVRQSVAAMRNSWVGTCANLQADADQDGIPDCLEAPSARQAGAKDNDVFGNALLFTAQQYRDFLSREVDADGLNYWTTAIASGSTARGTAIEGFLRSAEFQGAIAPVARLYFAYFLRIPDYAGLGHWIRQFKGGTPLGQISQAFAASPEFAQRYGPLSNAQFVTLVYNNVMGRAPDAAGLAHWTGQLNTGAIDRGAMMLAFSESPEYAGIIGNRIYVTMTYMGMLRREPDVAGFNHWVGYLGGGNSGLALVNSFLASAEYRGRFLQ